MGYKFEIEVSVDKTLNEDQKNCLIIELGNKLQEILGDAESGIINIVSIKS